MLGEARQVHSTRVRHRERVQARGRCVMGARGMEGLQAASYAFLRDGAGRGEGERGVSKADRFYGSILICGLKSKK